MLNSINVKYWELCHTSSELGPHRNSDYSARCDICGDSKKRKNLKRLHLYTKDSYSGDSIKCQNCSYTGTMYAYLRDYHPNLVSAYAQEVGMTKIQMLKESITRIEQVVKKNTLYTFERPSELVNPTKDVVEYLKSRGFTKEILSNHTYNGFKVLLSQGMLHLGKEKDKVVNLKDYIVIPLLEGDKWYGFYSRSIREKIFYTYLPDENTGYKLWNWFGVNKKDKVYIFEAIFNALSTSLPGVACLGSDIDETKLKELSKPIFVFDNDSTGREKSLKYAKKGHQVFIWPTEIKQKDVNDLLRDGMTVEEIDELIINNIFEGIVAVTKLTLRM